MSDYYELLIGENYEWDCDPQDPIHQALIEAVAVLAAQKAKEQEWKGPSWNDGHQVQPLLD
jgi:hypothetical protein